MLAEVWLWVIIAAGPLLFGAVEPWSLFLLQALLAMFPLVCALTLPKTGESVWKVPFVPALMIIMALGGLQLLWPRPFLGPQTGLLSTVDPARTSAALVLYACYGAVLVCAPRVLAREGAARRLAWMMFTLGAVIACVGLLQSAQGNTVIYGLRAVAPDRNPFGPYYNRNHAAALMAMALPIGAGLAYGRLSQWRRAGSFEAKSNLAAQAALFALPLVALGGGLYFISSRGASFGLLGASLLVFLGSLAKTKARKIILASALLLGGAVLARPLLNRVASVSPSADPSVATRVAMYSSGVELWKDSPLFGVGLGAFASAFAPYWDHPRDGKVDHLHCEWGEVVLESGIIGLGALALGLVLFLIRLGGNASLKGEDRAMRAGAVIAVGVCILHGFVEFSLRIPGNAVYFLAAAALACAAGSKQVRTPARGTWRDALVPALALGVFALLAGRRLAIVLPEVREAGLPFSAALNRLSVQGVEPSSDYRFGMAQAMIKRTEVEPAQRIDLLRAALTHAYFGLLYDSGNPRGNRIMAATLSGLGRSDDALLYQRRGAIRDPR